jgi:hypothetical protein
LFLPLAYNLCFSCSDDDEPPAHASVASPVAADEPAELDVAPRITRASVKKISQTKARNQKRAKRTKEAEVSLEAHVPMVSSDDVSDFVFACFPFIHSFFDMLFSLGLGKEIHRLGH